MSKEEVEKLVSIRMKLVEDHNRRKDWRNNRNAIMREIEHIEVIEATIKDLDVILKEYVTFS